MKKGMSALIVLWAVVIASPSFAAPVIDADFSDVTGDANSGYQVAVPGLGSLALSYGSPLTTYDGYNAGAPFFPGGDNFVLGAGNTITVSAVGFNLASAVFEIWDLDTVRITETVTFNPGGSMLTGVATNINNANAHNTDVQFSALILPDAAGLITIAAGPQGAAAFAIGGIQVTAVPVPAPILLLAFGLLGWIAAPFRLR